MNITLVSMLPEFPLSVRLEQPTPISIQRGLDAAAAFGLEPVDVVVQVGRQVG